MKKVGNSALVVLGLLLVVIGVVGIFLPVLPTTPFLLLAAACFSKSSKRLHSWTIRNRLLGSFIRNYQEKRGIRDRDRILSIVFVWAGIGWAVIMTKMYFWIKVLLLIIAIAVSLHLVLLKTLKKDVENATD